MTIEPSTPVDDVMRKQPATIRAFLANRMNCPGCPIARFHSVADACRAHDATLDDFLAELRRLAANQPGTG